MKWEEKFDKNGFKRMHHASSMYGGMMVVYGGYDDELWMIHFDFQVYDISKAITS